MKGISILVLFVFVLIIVSLLLVPAFIIFQSTPVYRDQGKLTAYPYYQLQMYQVNQVYKGNPNIYLNSTSEPNIIFTYSSVPYPFNVTQVYYFNGSVWVPVLSKPFTVSGNMSLPLPPQASNRPVIIVTGDANIFFLKPNSSLAPLNKGKYELRILSYIITGSGLVPVTLSLDFQGDQNYLTPASIYVSPGTYSVSINNGTFIKLFVKGNGYSYYLRAMFVEWVVLGNATVSSPYSISTNVTVNGPATLIALYGAMYSVT
jgi:hypothetical protein